VCVCVCVCVCVYRCLCMGRARGKGEHNSSGSQAFVIMHHRVAPYYFTAKQKSYILDDDLAKVFWPQLLSIANVNVVSRETGTPAATAAAPPVDTMASSAMPDHDLVHVPSLRMHGPHIVGAQHMHHAAGRGAGTSSNSHDDFFN